MAKIRSQEMYLMIRKEERIKFNELIIITVKNCNLIITILYKGDFIGTNLTGINENIFLSEEERYKLEELVEEYSTDFEIKMKFFKEFKVDVTEWKKLSLCTESIIACMDRAWNITRFYLEKYLLD